MKDGKLEEKKKKYFLQTKAHKNILLFCYLYGLIWVLFPYKEEYLLCASFMVSNTPMERVSLPPIMLVVLIARWIFVFNFGALKLITEGHIFNLSLISWP